MGIRVEGAKEVAEETHAVADRMRDPTPVLAAEVRALEAMIALAFDRDTAPTGPRWSPRLMMTHRGGERARRRSRRAPRGGLLEQSGRLRSGISVRAVDMSIVIESSAPYSGHVHAGTRYMRARPFLPLDSNFEPASTGPAGEWWAGFARRLADYVAEGRIEAASGR